MNCIDMIIPHSKPKLCSEELNAIIDVFGRGEIAVGPEIDIFEQAVAEYIGVDYAVAVSNGTAALHLTLVAMGIGPGDEVILPASVCPGVLHAIEYCSATPVIVDVTGYDFNVSPQEVQHQINSRTKAVVVPHMFGVPSDMDELLSYGVPVIEDCAQSIGALYRGKKVGSLGVASVFSFYATKMMTSIDGGMVLTNDPCLAAEMRDRRYYGGKHDYKLRFNYKLQNINAAVGLVQLEKLDRFIDERRQLFQELALLFERFDGIGVMGMAHFKKELAVYRMILNIRDDKRDSFKEKCVECGIVLGDTIFEDLACFIGQDKLVNAQELKRSTLSFPLYPGLNIDLIKRIFV